MVQSINCLSLLRALNAEEGNREVLTVEQFQTAVENNLVKMFDMLNGELANNKVIIA